MVIDFARHGVLKGVRVRRSDMPQFSVYSLHILFICFCYADLVVYVFVVYLYVVLFVVCLFVCLS